MAAAVVAAVAVVGSVMGSQAQSEQMENQAQAQEFAATETLIQGKTEALAIRDQSDPIIGSTVAAASGSGVQTDTGSVLDVIEETAFNIELDALTTESNARSSAEAQKLGAESTRAAKPTGLTTLLGAFGSGASAYGSVA